MSNLGLEKALADLGIPFDRAKVGDRYVTECLSKRGWTLGGESSGHILCVDLNTTGDGIIAALQVLMSMVEQDLDLSALVSEMRCYPQVMINVEVDNPQGIAECEALSSAIGTEEAQLGQRGRVLVRASGTEPLLRVMVEGEDAEEVEQVASRLAMIAEAQG
jgi:phosphoglucosamine mutase